MFRIITSTNMDAITITVDGRVTGEYVQSLRDSVRAAIQDRLPVYLFLRDVSEIDENGRLMLKGLARWGVHLRASGVYSSYLVAEINAAAAHGGTSNGSRE